MPPEELHNLVYTALHVGTYLIPLLRCTVAVAVMFSSDETEMYFIVHLPQTAAAGGLRRATR